MLIRLLPTQIPGLWPTIKFASINADGVSERDRPLYLNQLLMALLGDKAQCFVRLDKDRNLQGVCITRLAKDEVTGEKILFINTVYSFKVMPTEVWTEDISIIRHFADINKCKKIVTYSNSSRIFDIASSLGFKERYRCFVVEV